MYPNLGDGLWARFLTRQDSSIRNYATCSEWEPMDGSMGFRYEEVPANPPSRRRCPA